MSLHSGSCICGEVKYQLNSKILNVVNCHCNFCRSHTGAAFSTYVALPFASLEITEGREKLSIFEREAGKKHFCSICGTPIFNLNTRYPGTCMLYLGTLAKAHEITPAINIWCENKLGWVDTVSSIRSRDQGIGRRNKK